MVHNRSGENCGQGVFRFTDRGFGEARFERRIARNNYLADTVYRSFKEISIRSAFISPWRRVRMNLWCTSMFPLS